MNAKLTAKNEKFLADRKAALEREKQAVEPVEGEEVKAARPQEEIDAELAELNAEEDEAAKDKETQNNMKDELLAQ